MEATYKLQVKIGHSEFNAEGPEDTVKEAYEKFLSLVATIPESKPGMSPPAPNSIPTAVPDTSSPVDPVLLQRIFSGDPKKGLVSLRLLPPEGPSRAADAAILILYGFLMLQQQREVLVTKLKGSLKQSGIQIERLDHIMGVHSQFVIKGGTRIGGRYTLNNQGVSQAVTWIRQWFS